MPLTDQHFLDELLRPCRTADELHAWLRLYAGLNVPRVAVCPDHAAPFDYLCKSYFEPAADIVVWAPRGGGKTRLGAAATLLDLLHKPGVAVRILGGSGEQSLRMWEHLLPNLEAVGGDLVNGRLSPGTRVLRMKNRSTAAVLTQSERAVRGLRVQKLRCDEVELFDPDVWEAAQLVTRSLATSANRPSPVAGVVEALSTFHAPYGLMAKVIDNATARGTAVLRWGLLDVLERCPPERECASCPLWDDCGGIAKTRCTGFFRIDDAIAMKARVSLDTWHAEMLCKRPATRGCVFPSFDAATHVIDRSPDERETISLAVDFGFANPLVCLWVSGEAAGTVYVIDEYVQEQRTMAEHLNQIAARPWGKPRVVCCDPAGNSRNDQTAESNVQLLRSRGYQVRSRASQIIDGLEHIRARLQPAAGSPRLFIHRRCTRLIEAFRCYHYPPTGTAGGSELPVKDGRHDHLIDALRYWFVNQAVGRGGTRVY